MVSVKPLLFVPFAAEKLPTAQMSFAAAAETAFSFSSNRTTLGVGTWDHALPFQCSASMTWPSSSFGPRKLPTAQASVLVRAPTALNTLENATFCGDGSTVGVITHAGAAKAGPAKVMAAPTAGRTTAVRPAARRAQRPARFRLSSRVMVFIAEIPSWGAVPRRPGRRVPGPHGALMRRPAQTRADAVVDGELPALLSRLTVAVHVVVDAGTSVKRASAALELCSVPQPLPVTVEPVGTG
jgi:hypothetical protein